MTQNDSPASNTPNIWQNLRTTAIAAFLLATLFTAFSTNDFTGEPGNNFYLPVSQENTPLPDNWVTPTTRAHPRIGIVAGHWGSDSGATCPDGLTEARVNLQIATLVQQYLLQEGFDVDLLQEYDPKLQGYQARALVSIHADSCDYYNDQATGFKLATLAESDQNKAQRLMSCLRWRYEDITGLTFKPKSVTSDMTEYHAFQEIHSNTTAVIIETGYLNLDRQILTTQPERIAQGIVAGVNCFIYNEDASPLTPTPTSSP